MTIKFKKPLYSKKREVKIVVHKDLRAKAMPYPAKKKSLDKPYLLGQQSFVSILGS